MGKPIIKPSEETLAQMAEALLSQGFILQDDGFYYNDKLNAEFGRSIGLQYQKFIYDNTIVRKTLVDYQMCGNDKEVSFYRTLRTINRDIDKSLKEYEEGCNNPLALNLTQEDERLSTIGLLRVSIEFWSGGYKTALYRHLEHSSAFQIPLIGGVEKVSYTIGQYLESMKELIPKLTELMQSKINEALSTYRDVVIKCYDDHIRMEKNNIKLSNKFALTGKVASNTTSNVAANTASEVTSKAGKYEKIEWTLDDEKSWKS